MCRLFQILVRVLGLLIGPLRNLTFEYHSGINYPIDTRQLRVKTLSRYIKFETPRHLCLDKCTNYTTCISECKHYSICCSHIYIVVSSNNTMLVKYRL